MKLTQLVNILTKRAEINSKKTPKAAPEKDTTIEAKKSKNKKKK